jgi:hypothetical protein
MSSTGEPYLNIFGKMPDSAGCIHSDYLNLSQYLKFFIDIFEKEE